MEKRKPNLLLIMADQMHKYALGAVAPYVKTPNLDRLAAEGTLFANAYSNNPGCGPFRGILYSGRYSKDNRVQKNGQALREGEETLPSRKNIGRDMDTFSGISVIMGSGIRFASMTNRGRSISFMSTARM